MHFHFSWKKNMGISADADGQEEKKLREEAILKEQKLKLELTRANPRTRSQLARQFQMLSEKYASFLFMS